MKGVLVFKTSVGQRQDINFLRPFLDSLINTSGRWNFDLEDCDNILRVESRDLNPGTIISTLAKKGFRCEELH